MTTTIDASALTQAALALYDEAYLGSPNANGTWFVDNEPENGTLGTLKSLSAEAASRPASPGDPLTVASHAEHLRFSLSLANRAAKGENPYKDALWSESWKQRSVSEAEWRALLAALRREYEDFRSAIASGDMWKDEDTLTGTFGLICHGAWHLGAIRQALGLVKAPEKS
jgi:hypothetical protein